MALVQKPFSATPAPTKTQLPSNYISYFDFTSHFMPDTHEEIASRYGNQSVAGMLRMMGAEVASQSDKFIWTEEGRLHTVYKDVSRAGNVFTKANHVFRKGETVHLSDAAGKTRGVITAVDANSFTVASYKAAGFSALATTNITAFVDGSEHRKGTGGVEGSVDSNFSVMENSPIILKDKFEISGSDATNIGWVKTKQGYYWFMKSEEDTRRRWEDRLELAMILGNKAEAGSDAEAAGFKGTEGLFESISKRGNKFQGIATTLAEWDTIVKQLDLEGKVQDNMLYVDRDQSLAIDDLLGTLNAGYDGGVSYGIFNNSKDMAVNLGFKGFTRGTYNFFKTDWKMLNDPTLLGAVEAAAGKVRGVMLPVGTKEVYEGAGTDGEKIKVPFVHIKYKESPTESRKYKTWVTGSVGSATPTNDNDKMEIHHLSERGICTVGANNTFIFQGA
jgi:hypothetical protein